MPTEIRLPKLGLTMDEGTIVEWKKKLGDAVNEGDVLFEVETDKVTMEVESPSSGVLRAIVAEEGKTLPVGELVAIFTEPDEEFDESSVAALQSGSGTSGATERGAGRGLAVGGPSSGRRPSSSTGVRASPAAKRLARDHSIDLATVTGSGPGGRIVEADVQAAIATAGAPKATPPGEVYRLTPTRRTTGQRLTESFTTVPHYYLTTEVRADRLGALRQKELQRIETETGSRLSYTDLMVYCLAKTLSQHPLLNAAWHDGEVRLNTDVNIGVAMGTDDGLYVPIIHKADALSLSDITRQRSEYEAQSKSHKLTRESLQGGTFTLTNLGHWGIDSFSPIINPPQAAILAIGSLRDRATVVDGQLAVCPTVFMTLAADHRVLDGAQAADFVRDLRDSIESVE